MLGISFVTNFCGNVGLTKVPTYLSELMQPINNFSFSNLYLQIEMAQIL